MRFAFTDEQLAMRDAVRDFLEKECSSKVVRDAWTNDAGRSGLWRKLGDIGVLGVLAPEDQGGLEGDFLDLVLLLEETGRAALPEPVVEHAAVAVPELDDATDAASGAITATVVDPPSVSYADSADLVWANGQFIEPRTLVLEHRETVDRSRRLFTLGEFETPIAQDAGDRGVLGTAAQLLGLAQHMLDVSVEYAKQRHQFGVPIGSFQAIKHKLADVRLALEFARPVVYRAAYSIAHEDRERSVHVSMAKAYASDSALLASRHALQVHGAIGYSYEHDLHLWMKRAWALAAAWGDAASHRDRVGRAILDRDREEHRG
jgi:alkylation response protein AidB-like acyl-CoA dehydrogenase